MSMDPACEVVEVLTAGVEAFQSLDLSELSATETMALVGEVEVVRRRLDAATDALVGHLDDSGKHLVDGHRTAKAAVAHVGRLSGPEAWGRVRAARALRLLPAVADAYRRGSIPTGFVRAIARMASNPRIQGVLTDEIDKIIATLAAEADHATLMGWLGDFEALADQDGAAADSEVCHRRRRASFAHSPIDGSAELRASCGALQGAVIADVLAAFEAAEWEADRAAAIEMHGPDATADQLPRTPAQRRMDAIVQICRRAAATPADAQSPEPLVNLVIDQETFEDELARLSGTGRPGRRPDPVDLARRVDERVCRTLDGRPIHPADAAAAALVGHVRRVVVNGEGTVINLGRKRRLFTGSAREAARLQAAIAHRGGIRCWYGCDPPIQWQQVDHRQPWAHGGLTDQTNSGIGCPWHNRLKETGFCPVRNPDGTWTILRPDGTPITPPV